MIVLFHCTGLCTDVQNFLTCFFALINALFLYITTYKQLCKYKEKMNKKSLIILSLSCAVIGMLMYAFAKDLIIIRSPSNNTNMLDYPSATPGNKKKVTLYFWQHEKWHSETTQLVHAENMVDTIAYLLSSWLTLLEENEITQKKIAIQSVLLSPSGTDAYVSFDRNPFDKEATTHEKLMWIEGLLKTLRENGFKLQGVRFLVQHQPLQDYHLDFCKRWPISGFLESNS